MAIAPVDIQPDPDSGSTGLQRRRETSHLKLVPPSKSQRETLRDRAWEIARGFDKQSPLDKDQLETAARALLAELDQPEGYVGWTMVALTTGFWRDQVAAVSPQRRLLLLPQDADPGALGEFRTLAEQRGYQVLLAENTTAVLNIVIRGEIDAIVGVAPLDLLEKAIDKILIAGIPCMAVPLLDASATTFDADWVRQLIELPHERRPVETRCYVHLMRSAAMMFEPDQLERLAPRLRGSERLADRNGHGLTGLDPIGGTEMIAYDFLAKGGKHSRPFITLAVYDAMRGAPGTRAGAAEHLAALPDAVKRAALSIETFHKASLVHDDIEDNDEFRYGAPTLHQQYGVPTAINVGDYLIGLGYRLISRDAGTFGPAASADILDRLADAHMKLAEGQGAELLWRDSLDKRLTPQDALNIYALKTAPAFEAAMYAGLRMAGPVDPNETFLATFARNLGVAFQILNDLNDWREDEHNKGWAGGDVLGGRPTVLWALACESLPPAEQAELAALESGETPHPDALERVRALYEQADVFDKARRLIVEHEQRALAVAEQVEPDDLRRLLNYLVETVLARL